MASPSVVDESLSVLMGILAVDFPGDIVITMLILNVKDPPILGLPKMNTSNTKPCFLDVSGVVVKMTTP
jgi:hypothetical protein